MKLSILHSGSEMTTIVEAGCKDSHHGYLDSYKGWSLLVPFSPGALLRRGRHPIGYHRCCVWSPSIRFHYHPDTFNGPTCFATVPHNTTLRPRVCRLQPLHINTFVQSFVDDSAVLFILHDLLRTNRIAYLRVKTLSRLDHPLVSKPSTFGRNHRHGRSVPMMPGLLPIHVHVHNS